MLNEQNNRDRGVIQDNDNDSDLELYQNQSPQPLSKSQKIAVVVLAFFGILVVIFWAAQFQSNLKNSLKRDAGSSNLDINNEIVANEANKNNEALKNKDTDGDGLSDWEELNIYKTSPYLEDSYSDGYSDKQEIDTGNNPNCPMGQTCASTSADSNNSNSGDAFFDTDDAGLSNNSGNVNTGNNASSNAAALNIDAATLRAELEKAGVEKSVLDSTSDDELLKIYQDALIEQDL